LDVFEGRIPLIGFGHRGYSIFAAKLDWKSMRTVSQIPHPLMRITVTSWNEKYQLRFELDRYEQVFKVEQEESSILELEQLAKLMSESVLHGFVAMRTGYLNHSND